MTHHVNKCKHGVMLGQCRCASPNKVAILVQCPESHHYWSEDDHPVIYTGTYGQPVLLVAKSTSVTSGIVDTEAADRYAAISFMRRVSPITHEPLATAVAEEWADKLLADGWRRG